MDVDKEEEVEVEEEVMQDIPSSEGTEVSHISMHAIVGVPHFQTMTVTGVYNKRPVHILIDSGSTHNFLDETMAIKLGCKMANTRPMSVSIADGSQLMTRATCQGL